MTLVKIAKPREELTRGDETIVVKNQTISQWYGNNDQLYEHNESTGQWYKLVAEDLQPLHQSY